MSQSKQGKPTTPSKQESSQDASGPSVDNTIKEMLAQLQQSVRLQQELSERLEREREERIKQEVESRRRSLDSEQQLRDLASTISAVHEETTDRIEEIRALTFMDKHEKDPLPGLSARRSSLDPRVPKVTVEHSDYGVARGSEESDSDLGRPAFAHGTPAVHVMHVKEKVDPKLLIRSGSVAGRQQLEENWREWEIENSQRLPKIYLVHPDLRRQLVNYDQTAGTGPSANLLTMKNVHLISDTALDDLWSAMIRGHRMTTRKGYNYVFSKMFKPLEPSSSKWVFDSAENYDICMLGPFGRWVNDLFDAWSFVHRKATPEETKHWPPLGWCDPDDSKNIGQVQLAMLAMQRFESPFSAFVGRAEIKKLKNMSDWKDKFLQVNQALGKKAQEIRSDKAMFIDREDKKTLERNFSASAVSTERAPYTILKPPIASSTRATPLTPSTSYPDRYRSMSAKPGWQSSASSGASRDAEVRKSYAHQSAIDSCYEDVDDDDYQWEDSPLKFVTPRAPQVTNVVDDSFDEESVAGLEALLNPTSVSVGGGAGRGQGNLYDPRARKPVPDAANRPCFDHYKGQCHGKCDYSHDKSAMDKRTEYLLDQLDQSPHVNRRAVIERFSKPSVFPSGPKGYSSREGSINCIIEPPAQVHSIQSSGLALEMGGVLSDEDNAPASSQG